MESWYFPITILPSIGFFIVATSNLSTSLSTEITHLIEVSRIRNDSIIEKKIKQLALLGYALTLLYFSSVCMALAGLVAGLEVNLYMRISTAVYFLVCLGVFMMIIALILLCIYALRATRIKRDQFKQY